MKIVLITGHDYDAPRKTGFYFWAQILTERGVDVDWITVGLSRLTFLKPSPRTYTKPFNVWTAPKSRLRKLTWCPPVHPATFGNDLLNTLATPIFALYPCLLPRHVKNQIKNADIFIVESGAGPLLIPMLAKLCPKAKFIYNHSDRFNVVKFHPLIPNGEKKALRYFSKIRTNAAATTADFPPDAPVEYIPQAIDKDVFEGNFINPYQETKNAISVGDMLFDAHAIEVLAKAYPDWTFHLFGKKSALENPLLNVIAHGEVSFAHLVPYLLYADIGLAPYKDAPDAEYLSDSSLKLVQYTWCKLPIVAPDFATKRRDHAMAYNAKDVDGTIVPAFAKALTVDKNSIDRSNVLNWNEFLERMLNV